MKTVRIEHVGPTAVVTLDDPSCRNAISLTMAAELTDALTGLDRDESVHAVVLTGSGSAFCAGADRTVLRTADESALRQVYSAFLTVRDLGLPTIAAVNGPAVGAGFNLALACDVRIAAESAVFDSRFISIPIHPGGGHTWMLDRATSPQVAAAMTLFGAPLRGRRAAELGLAWKCVPDAELLQTGIDMCDRLADAPVGLIREIKETIRIAPGYADHREANEYELRRQVASTERPEYRKSFDSAR